MSCGTVKLNKLKPNSFEMFAINKNIFSYIIKGPAQYQKLVWSTFCPSKVKEMPQLLSSEELPRLWMLSQERISF